MTREQITKRIKAINVKLDRLPKDKKYDKKYDELTSERLHLYRLSESV